MTKYAFRGLESNGLLLKGAIPRRKAIELAGGEFQFANVSGSKDRVRCAVLVVQIEKIKTWNVPFLRWTYPEAVWMLELEDASYLAVKAHTPWYMYGALSLMDRYNTNTGAMALSKTENVAKVDINSKHMNFSVQLRGKLEGDTRLISRLWTRSRGGNYYRIPWGDNAPVGVQRMHCEVKNDQLGQSMFGPDIAWEDEAIYFVDRLHECAPAFSENPLDKQSFAVAKS